MRRRKMTTTRPASSIAAQHCFVILNTYPYTPGHVMVVPYAHLDELQKLPAEAAHEMMALSQRMEAVLRDLYRPDGINLGMNIGKAAGAGVAGHIHMHVLPRWVADCEFHVGGRRDADAAGDAGCDLGEDAGGPGKDQGAAQLVTEVCPDECEVVTRESSPYRRTRISGKPG